MERSSAVFAWTGDGSPPIRGLVRGGLSGQGGVSAVLVPGDIDPGAAASSVREHFGGDMPWAVYSPSGSLGAWLDAGASAFIPRGAPAGYISAALEGISSLSERAATRNPLSGLPGNVPITARLLSHVIGGDNLAAYFDISGFKPFNDYYGFSRGDAVLRSLASILKENLEGHFVGHVGGDDFIAVGRGGDFLDSVGMAVRVFNGRAGGFYSGRDSSAGGIEALDRRGEFRFYPVMDLAVSVVDGRDCDTVDDLARRAGLEKKRVRGELMPDTVSGFLKAGTDAPRHSDFMRWVDECGPDTVQVKALLEAAGILGDTGMTGCLADILARESDYRIRKSAARAIGSIAGRDSAEALQSSMSDGNAHVRTASTMALPFVMGKDAGPMLRDAVSDRSTWVRRAALRGLGLSGWPGAAEILARELERPAEGRYWLNYRQELAAALEGASFLGDPVLSRSVVRILHENPGVSISAVWKTLLTLGDRNCFEEMMNSIGDGGCHELTENLSSFDPGRLAPEEAAELESALISLRLRRRGDRIQVLKLIARIQGAASEGTAERLLEMIGGTDDPAEFETLLDTLKARRVLPGVHDLESIVCRLSGGDLRISRKALVSMLRWASTGTYSVSRHYLEILLRHDSREIRTAAARAVISLARRQRDN